MLCATSHLTNNNYRAVIKSKCKSKCKLPCYVRVCLSVSLSVRLSVSLSVSVSLRCGSTAARSLRSSLESRNSLLPAAKSNHKEDVLAEMALGPDVGAPLQEVAQHHPGVPL